MDQITTGMVIETPHQSPHSGDGNRAMSRCALRQPATAMAKPTLRAPSLSAPPPTFMTAASITPSSGVETDSTLAVQVAVDDGTTVSYSYNAQCRCRSRHWQSSSVTLDPSLVQPTQMVECTITATDGGETASSTSSVMIGNRFSK